MGMGSGGEGAMSTHAHSTAHDVLAHVEDSLSPPAPAQPHSDHVRTAYGASAAGSDAVLSEGRCGERTFLCRRRQCGSSGLSMSDLMLLPMYLCSFSNTCFTSCTPERQSARTIRRRLHSARRGTGILLRHPRERGHLHAPGPPGHAPLRRAAAWRRSAAPFNCGRRAAGGVRSCGAVVRRCDL
jgi:hypothetical protein